MEVAGLFTARPAPNYNFYSYRKKNTGASNERTKLLHNKKRVIFWDAQRAKTIVFIFLNPGPIGARAPEI